jgi:hypothetical protein
MTFGQNLFSPPRSLPTRAAINRRSRELLAYHQQSAKNGGHRSQRDEHAKEALPAVPAGR